MAEARAKEIMAIVQERQQEADRLREALAIRDCERQVNVECQREGEMGNSLSHETVIFSDADFSDSSRTYPFFCGEGMEKNVAPS